MIKVNVPGDRLRTSTDCDRGMLPADDDPETVDGPTLAWRSGASGPAGHRDAFEGVHTGKGFDWHFQNGYAKWRGIE